MFRKRKTVKNGISLRSMKHCIHKELIELKSEKPIFSPILSPFPKVSRTDHFAA